MGSGLRRDWTERAFVDWANILAHTEEPKGAATPPAEIVAVSEEQSKVYCGRTECGVIPSQLARKTKAFIELLLGQVAKWQETMEMRRVQSEIDEAAKEISDELTTILLRRIVPERCRYCPF